MAARWSRPGPASKCRWQASGSPAWPTGSICAPMARPGSSTTRPAARRRARRRAPCSIRNWRWRPMPCINGGFTDVGRMPASGLLYLRLTGKEPFAERIDTDPEKPGRDEFLSPDDLAAKAADELDKLVGDLLRSGKRGFLSRAIPRAPAISPATTIIWRGLPNGRPPWTQREVMAMTDDERHDVISQTTLRQNRAATPTAVGLGLRQCRLRQDPCAGPRVIRLLLRGARPSAILCLTYTKAAAAEMSNRVFKHTWRLGPSRRSGAGRKACRARRARD
jgi:hypothetical protein